MGAGDDRFVVAGDPAWGREVTGADDVINQIGLQ